MILRLLDPILNLHGLEAYAWSAPSSSPKRRSSSASSFRVRRRSFSGAWWPPAATSTSSFSSWSSCSAPSPATRSATWSVRGGAPACSTCRLLRRRRRLIDRIADQLNRRGGDRRVRRPVHRVPARRGARTGRHVRHALSASSYPPTPPGVSSGAPPSACWAISWGMPTRDWRASRAWPPTSSSASSSWSSWCCSSADGARSEPSWPRPTPQPTPQPTAVAAPGDPG